MIPPPRMLVMPGKSSTLDGRDLGVLRHERAEAPPEHLSADAFTQTSRHTSFLDPLSEMFWRLPRTTEGIEKLGWNDLQMIFATQFALPSPRTVETHCCASAFAALDDEHSSCCARHWMRSPTAREPLGSMPRGVCLDRAPRGSSRG